MTKQEQQQLVTLILTGDKTALKHVYNKLYPRLEKYIATKISNPKDIQEIAQDSFIAFIDALPLFSNKSSLWTFLISITKHEISDYYRRKYAKKAIKLVPLLNTVYDRRLQNSEQTAQNLHIAIEYVYQHLHPSQVKILRYKYEQKLSIKQIAKKLDISTKAAESKLYRARIAFQKAYIEFQGDPEFSVIKKA